MKKILLKTIALALMMAGLVSCGKDDKPNEPVKLKGTDWMLEGIVDVETDEMIELDIELAYTCRFLTFNTDTTAHGCDDESEIYLHLSPQQIFVVIKDEDDSYTGDVKLFYDAIKTITAYDITISNDIAIASKLKLYCNEGRNYLLYAKIIHYNNH